MKVFLLDDSGALGRYISRVQPAGSDCKVFCVDPSYYGSRESLDDFFHAILNKKAWRMAGNVQGEKGQSLKSLTGNASETYLFLIYVNLKPTKFSTRQDQEGIELLKHIRLTDKDELGEDRNTHVVLYSFEEQLTLLQRKPGNLIMLSEGVTFLCLPDGLNTMATPAELVKLADKRADVDRKDFKRFVQCDYQPPDSAHQFSNWWGLLRLIQARDRLKRPGIKRPRVLDEELARLENKQLLFLSNPSDIVTEDDAELKTLIENNQASIPAASRIVYIDDEPAWGETLKLALEADFESKVVVDYRCPDSEMFDTDKSLESWVKKIGLGTPDDAQTPLPPASLLLLDLRLLGNKENRVAVMDASGVKIARIVRRLNSGLPIILMTASNKAYSYEAAMKAGVDGYWMKEGVGEHLPSDSSIDNYRKLIRLIATALSEEYQLLRRIARMISIIGTKSDNWWNNYIWNTGESIKIKRYMVLPYLKSIQFLLRGYSHLFIMGYGYFDIDRSFTLRATLLDAILIEASKVCELIHNIESLNKDPQKRLETLERRNDSMRHYISSQRSYFSAHAGGRRKTISFDVVREVITGLMLFVQKQPEDRIFSWNKRKNLRDCLVTNPDLQAEYDRIYSGKDHGKPNPSA